MASLGVSVGDSNGGTTAEARSHDLILKESLRMMDPTSAKDIDPVTLTVPPAQAAEIFQKWVNDLQTRIGELVQGSELTQDDKLKIAEARVIWWKCLAILASCGKISFSKMMNTIPIAAMGIPSPQDIVLLMEQVHLAIEEQSKK
jgi:hypothetical protein